MYKSVSWKPKDLNTREAEWSSKARLLLLLVSRALLSENSQKLNKIKILFLFINCPRIIKQH
jgi:hypothetical protein